MEPEIIYQDRYLWMDVLSREVRRADGCVVHLEPRHWQVLARLIWYSGRPVYPRDFDWARSSLRNSIRELRDKLGFDLTGPIVKVHGVGYRYAAEPLHTAKLSGE